MVETLPDTLCTRKCANNLLPQTIPSDFHILGYIYEIYIDFSTAVIREICDRSASDSGIEWEYEDVHDLPESTCSIDVAFDEDKLDAVIFGSP